MGARTPDDDDDQATDSVYVLDSDRSDRVVRFGTDGSIETIYTVTSTMEANGDQHSRPRANSDPGCVIKA